MNQTLRLFRKLRRHGMLRGFSLAAMGFWQRLLKIERVFRAGPASTPVEKPGFRFVVIHSHDSQSLESYFQGERLAGAKRRLLSGDILVCGFQNRELAAYGWGQVKPSVHFSYVANSLHFHRDVLYVYDCVTLKAFRGQGLFAVVLRHFAELASGRDCYVACRAGNTNSVRGIRKAGFYPFARLYLLNLYFFRVTWITRQQG
ncbi:MAG: hypothetical protein R3296_14585 [Oleiphilaceae bacterium]|nr:hypothetical protein [Oleiphilaceae bacterium]